MANLLLSRFETYLLDQEVELECKDGQNEQPLEQTTYEQYPAGFFSSL